MDTAIQRDFAGGRFTFFLTVPSILAIERGPVNPAHRVREYPVSLFEIYDELSAGVGINQITEEPTLLPGLRVFYGDLHHILERALVDGASGDKDGETFKVDSQLASRLVGENLPRNYEGCALLAWDILRTTIKGIDLKKKPVATADSGDISPSDEGR